MTRGRAWVLGAACAAAIACAAACAGQAARSSAPPAAQTMPGEPATDPRAEITALDREIAAELARAQIEPPAPAACAGASCASAMAEPFATPTTADPACHPAPSERCTDVCKLGTSICRNQERICALAGQLPGDDWAANTCTRARASCQAAHERCCSCGP